MKLNLNDLMILMNSGCEEFSLEDIERLTGKCLNKDEVKMSDTLFSSNIFGDSEEIGTSRLGVSKEESKSIFDEVFGPDVRNDMFTDSDKNKPVSSIDLFGEKSYTNAVIDVSDVNNKIDYLRNVLGDEGVNNLEHSLNLLSYYEENKDNSAFQKRIKFVSKLKANPEVLQIKREISLVKTLIGYNLRTYMLSKNAKQFCVKDFVLNGVDTNYGKKAFDILDRFADRVGLEGDIHNDHNYRTLIIKKLLLDYDVPSHLRIFAIARGKSYKCLSQKISDLISEVNFGAFVEDLKYCNGDAILESLIVGEKFAPHIREFVEVKRKMIIYDKLYNFTVSNLYDCKITNPDYVSDLFEDCGFSAKYNVVIKDGYIVDCDYILDKLKEEKEIVRDTYLDLHEKFTERVYTISSLEGLKYNLIDKLYRAYRQL